MAGDNHVAIGNRAINQTSRLVLIGTVGIADSVCVKQEIEQFRKNGKKILAIGFGNSIELLRQLDPKLSELLTCDEIYITESTSALSSGPSEETLQAIEASVKKMLVRKRRQRVISGFMLLLLAVIVGSTKLYYRHQTQAKYDRAIAFLVNELTADRNKIPQGRLQIGKESRRTSLDAIQLVDAVTRIGGIKEVSILDCDIQDLDAIRSISKLQVLNLYESRGVKTLKFVNDLQILEELMVHDGGLTDETLLETVLPPSLQKLKLTNNQITSAGFEKIITQLPSLPNLCDLNMGGCNRIRVTIEQSEAIVKHIVQVNSQGKMCALDLSATDTSAITPNSEVMQGLTRLKNAGNYILGFPCLAGSSE